MSDDDQGRPATLLGRVVPRQRAEEFRARALRGEPSPSLVPGPEGAANLLAAEGGGAPPLPLAPTLAALRRPPLRRPPLVGDKVAMQNPDVRGRPQMEAEVFAIWTHPYNNTQMFRMVSGGRDMGNFMFSTGTGSLVRPPFANLQATAPAELIKQLRQRGFFP